MALLQKQSILKELANSIPYTESPRKKRVLMVHPQYFSIEYAINPHMKDSEGKIKKIDSKAALEEWKLMIRSLESCGLDIEIIDGVLNLPDMVFAANAAFPFWNYQQKRPEVLLSNMAFPEREAEVKYFESWFKSQDYIIHRLDKNLKFEGTGDGIADPCRALIWCGYGYRSEIKALEKLSEITQTHVIPLKLVDEKFYHLDTCFAPLNSKTVVYQPEAFDDESRGLIEAAFENCIACDLSENSLNFAANLFCPDGRNVFIDNKNQKTIETLNSIGFRCHPLETHEFKKAGGSVFCMKLSLW